MKILLIGGTGKISMAISKQLLMEGHELYLINRGNRNQELDHVTDHPPIYLTGDVHNEETMKSLLSDLSFDAVADFIAFHPSDLERDYRLFCNKTRQFLFISSASAYQKPLANYQITESTPLSNPYWEYSREKIEGENYLMHLYRKEQFPVTIVRPSSTYDERSIPAGIHGAKGSFSTIKRILSNKPVIIHGDGTSLWTITHNSDFARGFIGLLGNIHAIGETVHITSDETVTWNQIYSIIADALGCPDFKRVHISSEFLAACGKQYDFAGALLGDKANSVVFDNRKLKQLVPGFTATKRADQGIRESIQYILSHPECQMEDPAFDMWCDKVIAAREKALRSLV